MELSALLIFAGALLVAAGSPGPSVAALVSRVIARDWRDVIPFAAAMWLGEALWLTLAVYGLAALAEALHGAFLVVKYLGAAYLLYLASRMWSAPVAVAPGGPAPRSGSSVRMFLAGLAVTLGNPKIMVFYLALLPTIIDLAGITLVAWVELTSTMLVVLAAIDLAYIVLAARARQLLRSPRALRIANRTSAPFSAVPPRPSRRSEVVSGIFACIVPVIPTAEPRPCRLVVLQPAGRLAT